MPSDNATKATMSVAFIFPGQGSQTPGMGQALAEAHPEAADVFRVVDEALGENLSATLWRGTAEELTLTRIAQPATDKATFELMSLGCAAMAGCEACNQNHESSLVNLGVSEDACHDAVRIAAVVRGAITGLC